MRSRGHSSCLGNKIASRSRGNALRKCLRCSPPRQGILGRAAGADLVHRLLRGLLSAGLEMHARFMRMTPNGPFEEPDDDLADLNVYGSHVEEDDDEDDLDDAYDEGDYDAAPGALPLPISDSQQRSLQRTLDEALQSHGCDGSLRATEAWAAARGIGWPRLRRALEASGGYCDCEVLMNVVVPPEPDDLEGLLPDELADGDSTT